MKGFLKFLLFVGFVAGVVYVVQKILAQPTRQGAGAGVLPETPITPLEDAPLGGEISPQLLEILVDPEDKGALELVDEGKFLLNPRNGYRYPIRNGIPVMLIEEGKKYQDKSRIASNGSGQKSGTTESAN
ncbi:MAG: Trm112 family protein [Caldilineaceae bacterium]|nr:Trm112 family protein [Caldilineaceae bacterium]